MCRASRFTTKSYDVRCTSKVYVRGSVCRTSWYNKCLTSPTSMAKVPVARTVSIPGAVSSEFAHLVCLAQGSCVAGASLQTFRPEIHWCLGPPCWFAQALAAEATQLIWTATPRSQHTCAFTGAHIRCNDRQLQHVSPFHRPCIRDNLHILVTSCTHSAIQHAHMGHVMLQLAML